MSLISFTPLQDGVTGVNASATNNPLNTIYNDYNGNITDANIASNAAIAGSKIAYASISNTYKFRVYRNGSQNVGTAATKIQFETKSFDTNSNFDNVTNFRYTAPISGFYFFTANAQVGAAGSGAEVIIDLYKNGSQAQRGNWLPIPSGLNPGVVVSAFLQVAANDYFEVFITTTAAAKALDVSVPSANNSFSGFLVSGF